jgi:competence protein ComEA
MDILIAKITPLLLKYKLPLSLGILGVILLGYGLISAFSHQAENKDIVFTPGNESIMAVKTSPVEREITVDVSGAVIESGVYQLPEGARVQDALIKAGGMNEVADRELVAKQINLAAKLVDGAKIYIPRLSEAPSVASNATYTGSSGQVNLTSINNGGSQLININTAGESDLDALSGIGKVTSGKIIYNSPYGSIDELIVK